MKKYARTLLPCVYDDYVAEAKAVITHTQRNAPRKLLDFRFKRNLNYNWNRQQLTMVEKLTSERVKEILD